MASPRLVSDRSLTSSDRRPRRSAFNGAKQLSAAQAPNQRILLLLVGLALGLVAALAVIIGMQMVGDQPETSPTSFIHQASR
ncbi:MAG: hypothetical protein ACRYG7_15080 [Janthinobacterium lividum]